MRTRIDLSSSIAHKPGSRQAIDPDIASERSLQIHVLGAHAVQNDAGRQLAAMGDSQLPDRRREDKDVAADKLASHTSAQPADATCRRRRRNHYFANAPNRTDRDLIDFLLWQKKADQLGIKFTTDDIKKLIDKEFYSFFQAPLRRSRSASSFQQQMAQFNMDRCLEAIGEEFRRARRPGRGAGLPTPIGGRGDKTFGGFPMFSTPYEVYEFYREQCSPTTYGVIPVPAINFILARSPTRTRATRSVSPGTPRPVDKYKDDEPNPAAKRRA